MPLEIAVADGKLAVWHRFDVQDKAVVKDRHVLMALADDETNALELLNSCWSKLGYVGSPPNRTYFTREDGGLNKAGTLPGAPSTAPTLSSRTATRIVINIDVASATFGGSLPTFVRVRAFPSIGGTPVTTFDTALTYPWATTAQTVNTLTTATQYDVSYAIGNSAGFGPYSSSVLITTL